MWVAARGPSRVVGPCMPGGRLRFGGAGTEEVLPTHAAGVSKFGTRLLFGSVGYSGHCTPPVCPTTRHEVSRRVMGTL